MTTESRGAPTVQHEHGRTQRFSRGLIIGKFMLLHMGHCFLIDTALKVSKTVHLCLCSRRHDVMDGMRRLAWIERSYEHHVQTGALVFHHIQKEIPEAHVRNPNAPSIWAREISALVRRPFDAVFASEAYGADFARTLNAQFVPIDTQRGIVPVSSTEIQTHVHKYWRYIAPAVREELLMVFGLRTSGLWAQRFTDAMHASMYLPYGMRENGTHTAVEYTNLVAAAQLQTMRCMSEPVLCILLPNEEPEQYYEFSQCHAVFSINSDEELDHAIEEAHTFISTRMQAKSA